MIIREFETEKIEVLPKQIGLRKEAKCCEESNEEFCKRSLKERTSLSKLISRKRHAELKNRQIQLNVENEICRNIQNAEYAEFSL